MCEQRRDFDDPDVAYTRWIEYDYARRRTALATTNGDIRWFVVRLEYNASPGFDTVNDWRQVAGFDHHPTATWGHDVTAEGLHIDIYRDGAKIDVKRGFPSVPINEAPAYCERYLDRRADELIEQFERWHGFVDL